MLDAHSVLSKATLVSRHISLITSTEASVTFCKCSTVLSVNAPVKLINYASADTKPVILPLPVLGGLMDRCNVQICSSFLGIWTSL